MNRIPTNFLIEKFYSYAGSPVYNRYTKVYNGSCPACREGRSWLKKKRLFFYPETNSFYCFNCVKGWNEYTWLYEVADMSKEEIDTEIHSGDFSRDLSDEVFSTKKVKKEISILPHDSINIKDFQQRCFYGTNQYFQKALEYIQDRRLDTAVNKSPTYYISLTDKFHRNRLCVPYYDLNNKIVFYQTRSLDGSNPRYLNKVGCDKTLFGIERISPDVEYIFLFEGPMDAMMVRNGVAVAGLTLTDTQEAQLANFPFHQKIWVLDNPRIDDASKENTSKLALAGEKVFKWPETKYKDFNEWAVAESLNEIDYNLIVNSLY